MAANAKRGLELRRKHGRGGTAVGVARARDISNRKTLSPETVRRMHAFFSRHEKNKAGGEDDAGYIAWLLWGGDSGQGWAKRKVEQMDKSENQRSETYRAIAERLGSAAKHERSGDKPNGSEAVEAYGVKGMKSTPWRKVFKSVEAMQKWAEANDAEIYGTRPANGSFSRPGAKARFAQPPFSASDLNALKRLVKQYEQQAKTSKGKQGPNGENLEFKALSIAGWMQEMINYAQAGQTHRAYSIVRTSNPDYVRFLPPSLVKAAWDVTKMSRPGAKAKMGANEDRKRAAGYKWQVRYTKQLGKTDYLGGSPQVIEDTVYFATESAARDWANTMLGKGWFKGMGGSPEKVLTAKVLMFSRPGAKDTNAVREGSKISAEDEACLKVMSAADAKVSDKIRTLIAEGKPQKQAVAIALDLKRRGEL